MSDDPVKERHTVREPREADDGVMLGLAVVELQNDDVLALEHFAYNDDGEAVLAQEPFAVEKETLLMAIPTLNNIYKRDYKNDE